MVELSIIPVDLRLVMVVTLVVLVQMALVLVVILVVLVQLAPVFIIISVGSVNLSFVFGKNLTVFVNLLVTIGKSVIVLVHLVLVFVDLASFEGPVTSQNQILVRDYLRVRNSDGSIHWSRECHGAKSMLASCVLLTNMTYQRPRRDSERVFVKYMFEICRDFRRLMNSREKAVEGNGELMWGIGRDYILVEYRLHPPFRMRLCFF